MKDTPVIRLYALAQHHSREISQVHAHCSQIFSSISFTSLNILEYGGTHGPGIYEFGLNNYVNILDME